MCCLALLLVAPAPCQRADSLPIQLDAATHRAIMKDSLSGGQQLLYSLTLHAGDKPEFSLSSMNAASLRLLVKDPQNQVIGSASRKLKIAAKQDGDYIVLVMRTGEKAGSSSYILTVTVR